MIYLVINNVYYFISEARVKYLMISKKHSLRSLAVFKQVERGEEAG